MAFTDPKTSRSRRSIALDPETVRILRRHRDTQILERDFAGDSYGDRDLVLADPLGGAIHSQSLTKAFGHERTMAGIPTGTLHVLRHTHATLALTNGVPVHVAAAGLGDDPKTILSVYAHLLPQSDEAVASIVAVALL